MIDSVIIATTSAMAKIQADTWTSGPGLAILKILFFTVAGTIISYILSAIGKGQMAKFVSILIVVGAIWVVAEEVINILMKLLKFMGLA
ncbi:MAG: hypothetical protein ACYDG6_09595 [Thermincolia bacterium]